jgi:hypothetical protein
MTAMLAVLLGIGMVIFGWNRNGLRRLTRDYARKDPFKGDLVDCLVRFAPDDASTDCILGANSEGLYMSSSIDALERNRRWSFRYYVIKTPIFIPWSDMQIGDAKFPLRRYLRFSVPSNKAVFFIPRETGRLLQSAAGGKP